MNSIPQSDETRKRVRVIRGGLGYVLKGQKETYKGAAVPSRTRGDIKGFSRASARRLRERLALARLKSGAASVWGLTLTIPGKVLPPSEVRRLWHDFIMLYRLQFEGVPLLWRIELQTRKQAHWHCVIWLPAEGASFKAVLIAELWKRTVRSHVGALTLKTDMGFDVFGVDLKCLDGASATGIIGYLADHTSKHKRDQLGWRGRQWGVVNRSALDFEGETVAELDESDHKHAARQFRRLQEHLRNGGGAYTGGGVTPSGNIQRSIFGRDALRYLSAVENEIGRGC